MAARIKKGDLVTVISGSDKGKTGRVLKVIPTDDRVVVEGVNRVWKHVKRSQRYPQGGRIQMDAPIRACKVLPVDPSTNKPTRVKFVVKDGGKKHRIAKSGADLGVVGGK
jgi:large subunit ribosomal protein L24